MLKKSFYSHGKLLLTSEYLVLDGIKALAVPTKKGQWLTIHENDSENITWKSFDENENCWFETSFEIKDQNIQVSQENNVLTSAKVTETLIQILSSARELNSNFLSKQKGYTVETKLEFHREWGLGSSSTLINNIAQWAEVNALPYYRIVLVGVVMILPVLNMILQFFISVVVIFQLLTLLNSILHLRMSYFLYT